MIGSAFAAGILGLPAGPSHAALPGRVVPPFSGKAAASSMGLDSLVLAGGCFWGTQGVFQHVRGVAGTRAGYAGGDRRTATYEAVGTGRTAHAEAVRIAFDSGMITQAQLLQIFFSVAHDPTQLNRQGPDIGPQYRTAIFPRNEEQARIARAYIAELDSARAFDVRIATQVEVGKDFFPAEAHHQDFMVRHPANPYIVAHERPKLEALFRLFPHLYRAEPVLAVAAPLV